MDLYQEILRRRSTRKYTDREISRQDLEKILLAAKHAPTGMDRQLLKFFALLGDRRINELEEAMRKDMGNDRYSLRQAKAMVLVTSDPESPHREPDTACAMMNIHYAAQSLGLGACWINQLRLCIDGEHVRPLLTSWGVPENYLCLGMMALGYPDETPVEKKRVEEIFIIE